MSTRARALTSEVNDPIEVGFRFGGIEAPAAHFLARPVGVVSRSRLFTCSMCIETTAENQMSSTVHVRPNG